MCVHVICECLYNYCFIYTALGAQHVVHTRAASSWSTGLDAGADIDTSDFTKPCASAGGARFRAASLRAASASLVSADPAGALNDAEKDELECW